MSWRLSNSGLRGLPIAIASCALGSLAAFAAEAPPPGSMNGAPPPLIKGTVVGKGGVEARTPAPDGLGETTARAGTAGEYAADKMTYVPWKDATVIKPLAVGTRVPAGSVVRTQNDETFDLDAAVARQPTVLIFFRGGWCPYCNAHLRDLQQSEPALRDMGYQLLAISTDTPEQLRAMASNGQFSYTLLSDVRLEVAAKFGLRYQLDERYIAHVKAKPDERAALAHVDLQEQTGGNMLTPAAFILDRAGTIRFVYANNNYSVRVKQNVLLDAARAALRSELP